ncbi:hypothetical protein ASPBRDRAFT_45216 [Aspergillus brasiliensis CBS 101740]|uniref:Major facilitator superfamily (MFS) profile domain-containing protein n=1 Tax=Aspergillus brasiliensis (strain CBS 101740 / IMI 381727 / IBT 21946) TaxID=767769 RepID=A0A1L9UE53_ASPBC|nr:hypothetical protein ASPBRDRAFT_45216 [Aspergillus brasiliensis CBS 101740]
MLLSRQLSGLPPRSSLVIRLGILVCLLADLSDCLAVSLSVSLTDTQVGSRSSITQGAKLLSRTTHPSKTRTLPRLLLHPAERDATKKMDAAD